MIRQLRLDQWGVSSTPKIWSHDNMSITTPNDEINNEPNKTYPQVWTAYNQAQTQEKILFLELLHEITSQIPQSKRNGAGRPKANLSDMVLSCCLKQYLDFSSRRSESDMQMVMQLGYINHAPHFNTILKYLNEPVMKKVLMKLIEISAIPLKEVETDFAMDASGFSSVMYGQWLKK